MLVLTASMALVATAACTDVKIIWKHAKISGQTSLDVYSNNTLIAQSCSSVISSPETVNFSNVNDNGFGQFTVGTANYTVHYVPQYSGGPVCTKIHSAMNAVVECSGVPWTAPIDGTTLSDSCHEEEDHEVFRRFLSPLRAGATQPPPKKRRQVDSGIEDLQDRNVPDCNILTTTSRVGDGNPHQNFYDKQLSQVINCGAAAQCEAGHSESVSYSVEFSASATVYEWLNGGFAVSKSWETGNDYSCTGTTGEKVCVWYNTAHTAYTVQNQELNSCDSNKYSAVGGTFVLSSPNTSNRNGGYYCVVGTCRAQGDAYWDRTGRAGGP